jgi:hypothetical protein
MALFGRGHKQHMIGPIWVKSSLEEISQNLKMIILDRLNYGVIILGI